MILILADTFDTHADAVEQQLREVGRDPFRLNLDVESLQSTALRYLAGHWIVEASSRNIRSDHISCIWARRLTVSLSLEQQNEVETPSFRIWRSEWNRSLYGLYASLRDRFWINPVAQSALADNKYYQFDAARAAGFLLPPMITSNVKSDLLRFIEEYDNVVAKFMSQDMYKMEDGSFAGLYVNKVSRADITAFGDMRENPLTLQKYINKDFEVRHTFVAGSHFSCKIESQLSPRASVDWRRYDLPHTPHSVINAPHEVIAQVDDLMKRLGLIYGAFDFIIDQAGQWWFLEVNSAGQWLWIEDLTGLPISSAVSDVLNARSERP